MVDLACRHTQKYPSKCSVSGQIWKCFSDCSAASVHSCTALLLCMPLVRPCLARPSLHPFLNALSYSLLTNPLFFHLKRHGYFYTQIIHWGCSLQPLLPSPPLSLYLLSLSGCIDSKYCAACPLL